MTDLSISCDCGNLQGVLHDVSPKRGARLVCYCDDCQAFAEYLGKRDQVLDRNGGSDIFQTLPSRLKITEGSNHLACVQLTEKGVLRWFADCCRSPVGNTANTRNMPFVGLLTSCLRKAASGATVDDAIGPNKGAVFLKYAKGDVSTQRAVFLPALLFDFARRMIGAKLSGAHKINPFFNADDTPVVTPHLVSAEERRAIDERLAAR